MFHFLCLSISITVKYFLCCNLVDDENKFKNIEMDRKINKYPNNDEILVNFVSRIN